MQKPKCKYFEKCGQEALLLVFDAALCGDCYMEIREKQKKRFFGEG